MSRSALDIVRRLKVQPELRPGPEITPEPNSGVGGYVAPGADEIADAVSGHAYRLRDRAGGQPERLHEFQG